VETRFAPPTFTCAMPDLNILLDSIRFGSSTSNVTTADHHPNVGCQSPFPDSLSVIDSDRSPPIEVPGAMHGYQIVTEPECMDERDMAGIGSNKGRVYLLQYESIDEETQAGDLTDKIDVPSKEPKVMGGFSDIYQGTWRHRVSIDNQTGEGTLMVGAISHVSVDCIERATCRSPSSFCGHSLDGKWTFRVPRK
jgi:hypothetical protein